MSDLEDFIKKTNPEAYERWKTWHRQSLIPHEQVFRPENRFLRVRPAGRLEGIWKFVFPFESTLDFQKKTDLTSPCHLDFLAVEDLKKTRKEVFMLDTWHLDYLLLSEKEFELYQNFSKESRDWYKNLRMIWEPWAFKSEDWK